MTPELNPVGWVGVTQKKQCEEVNPVKGNSMVCGRKCKSFSMATLDHKVHSKWVVRDETGEIVRSQTMKGPVCHTKADGLASVGSTAVGKWPFLVSYSGSSMESRKDQRQDQKQGDKLEAYCNSPRERWLGSWQRGCIGDDRKGMSLSLRLLRKSFVVLVLFCFVLILDRVWP